MHAQAETRGVAIPAAGAAIVELLNSRAHAIHPDGLDDPKRVRNIAERFDPAGATLEVDTLRAVRNDLFRAVSSTDQSEIEAAWLEFNDHTRDVAFQHDFIPGGPVNRRQIAGDPTVGGIALAVADLVNSGAWSRVRVCANPTCEGAFYDITRSRTQKWHSYEICGNRANVAAYRARRN